MFLFLYYHVASTIMVIIVGGGSVASDGNTEKPTRCLTPVFPCPVPATTTTTMATPTSDSQPPTTITTKATTKASTTATSATITSSTTEESESATVSEYMEYWEYNYTNNMKDVDPSLFADDPETEVKFLLYDDSENPDSYKNITWGNLDSLSKIQLNGAPRLKIVIHGFADNPMDAKFQRIKNNYLDVTKYKISNQPVLLVNWSSMAGGKCSFLGFLPCPDEYQGVVQNNVPRVASHIRQLLSDLRNNNLIDSMRRVHLIGHSLGAQMSGLIGNEVQQYHSGENVSRITGMDPAGPIYSDFRNNSDRLDASDADFVDATHSSQLAGYYRRTGHADFFPNPGLSTAQPGCTTFDARCSHRYAVYIFAKSIYDESVRGCPYPNVGGSCSNTCSSDVVYGEHISETASSYGQFCFRAGDPVE